MEYINDDSLIGSILTSNSFSSVNKKDGCFIIEFEDSLKYDTDDLLILAREHMENNDLIALNLYEVNSRTMYTVQKIEMGYSIFNRLSF